jgi:hypothetical protein
MTENLKLLRPYFVMLAVVTVGRWLLGVFAVPYEKGTGVFSIVTLTIYASAFYGIFLRGWHGKRIVRVAGVAMTAMLVAQGVILLSTVASYVVGVDSYFVHPTPLGRPGPVTVAEALLIRLGGLFVNVVLAGIAGGLGWALGALLPGPSHS